MFKCMIIMIIYYNDYKLFKANVAIFQQQNRTETN